MDDHTTTSGDAHESGPNMNEDRAQSLKLYDKRCPVTMRRHDWRMATDAPGWKLGDYCVRCENCRLKAIVPTREDQRMSRV